MYCKIIIAHLSERLCYRDKSGGKKPEIRENPIDQAGIALDNPLTEGRLTGNQRQIREKKHYVSLVITVQAAGCWPDNGPVPAVAP
jgi:hypothetical protein